MDVSDPAPSVAPCTPVWVLHQPSRARATRASSRMRQPAPGRAPQQGLVSGGHERESCASERRPALGNRGASLPALTPSCSHLLAASSSRSVSVDCVHSWAPKGQNSPVSLSRERSRCKFINNHNKQRAPRNAAVLCPCKALTLPARGL